MTLHYTAFLPWEQASAALTGATRRALADDRAAGYELMLACADRGGDPAAVTEVVTYLRRLRNEHCRAANRAPTSSEFDAVLAGLGYHSDYLIEDGHAWTHGLGEQRRYAIQHTLGFQIWELDQPHLLHAHGRSLTGYTPSAAENRQLSEARAQFTEAAQSDAED